MTHTTTCELCAQQAGIVLWQDARLRVVLVDDPDYAGFCRVIWNAHVKEMTDLPAADRAHFMRVVFAVEQTLRDLLRPDKINLASLGNVTPHLHWHVIPRFTDDPHFPQPIWGTRQRDGATCQRAEKAHAIDIQALRAALAAALVANA